MSKAYSWASRLTLGLAVLAASVLSTNEAHAGGLYLFDRGARALGRGGAFVAGVDDPSALWYNPAGLLASKNQLVADAVLPVLLADFTKMNGDGSYGPTVTAKPTPIPIPTLAISHLVGKKLAWGAGILAPMVVLMNWEQSVGKDRQPSPTRYSLLELKGTVLANVTAGFAYQALDWLTIGADLQFQMGYLRAKTALTGCDGVICNFPEEPTSDFYATVKTFPTYGLTGVIGAIADFKILKFGASVMLPYTLRGRGWIDVKMPTSALFEDAYLDGDKVKINVKFPTILRFGSELKLVKWLALEGDFVWEQWSRQKSIDIKTDGVRVRDVTGIGDYDVGDVKIERKMKNVWSLRGGFEASCARSICGKLDFQLRGGLAYETGAFTSQTLQPFTIDTNKVVLSGGFTIGLAKWLRFDTVAGLIFMQNLDVKDSTIRQPQAIRPPNSELVSVIGNGRYEQTAFFLGGGFRAMTDMKTAYKK
ncbi:MAG: outer membrane protein transport protein [Polyangiales bacterium]